MADNKTKNNDGNRKLEIHRIYTKRIIFSSPEAPDIFFKEFNPEISVDLKDKSIKLDDNKFEVELSVTVNAITDKTVFNVEVVQAAIFLIDGFTKEQLEPILGAYCLNVIFPYAREIVTNITVKAGFPQLILSPVNFDALFFKKKENKNKEQKNK